MHLFYSDNELAQMTLSQNHETASGHELSLCEIRSSYVPP